MPLLARYGPKMQMDFARDLGLANKNVHLLEHL